MQKMSDNIKILDNIQIFMYMASSLRNKLLQMQLKAYCISFPNAIPLSFSPLNFLFVSHMIFLVAYVESYKILSYHSCLSAIFSSRH